MPNWIPGIAVRQHIEDAMQIPADGPMDSQAFGTLARMSVLPIERREGSRPDIIILRPDGPLTIRILGEFAAAVKSIAAPLLVLDLEAVPHMDSAGLGAILNLFSTQQKAGNRLVLARPSQRVQMLINLTKVDTMLKVYPTVEAAEEA